MEATIQDQIRQRRAALIIVDLQNDYCHPKGKFVTTISSDHVEWVANAIEPIKALIDSVRSAGDPVVFVRTHHRPQLMSAPFGRRYHTDTPLMFCEPGTWGADFFGVTPEPQDVVITKHRYAGFYNTSLETALRSQEVDTLAICGFSTNVCVETTVREAAVRDYYVVVPEDCCVCTSRTEHEASLQVIGMCFGLVLPSERLRSMWASKR